MRMFRHGNVTDTVTVITDTSRLWSQRITKSTFLLKLSLIRLGLPSNFTQARQQLIFLMKFPLVKSVFISHILYLQLHVIYTFSIPR